MYPNASKNVKNMITHSAIVSSLNDTRKLRRMNVIIVNLNANSFLFMAFIYIVKESDQAPIGNQRDPVHKSKFNL